MQPLGHATISASRFTPFNDPTGQTALTDTLLSAGNSARAMESLSTAKLTVANPDIPPPVLVRPPSETFLPDFSSQADLDERWEAFKTHLKTQPLSEEEASAFVRSGILQEDAGKAVADLIEGAMLRAVRPKGSLTRARLKEIVKVICHHPPEKWPAALGENLGFVDGKTDQGLKGFLHAQMEHLRTVRDEKIANGELLSDPYWDRLNALAKEGRSYIRSSDGELDAALRILEDAKDLRPTPKAAYAELEAFIGFLEQKEVARVRWPDHYMERVNELCDEIKPNDDARAGWREVLTATSWLAWMFGCTDLPPASTDAPGTAPTNDDVPPLLATLQAFERSGSFYNHVTNNGPRIPQSFAGKLLWACNALDTFSLLKMDRSHIVSGPGPGPAPTKEAWKNGASDFPLSPLEPEAIPMDPLAMLEQFSTQADEILNLIASKLVPWNSAYADDLEEVVVMLDSLRSRVNNPVIERSHSSALWSGTPDIETLGQQFGEWLSKMSATLVSTGVAVMSRTGDLIERNPRSAMGVFTAYIAISNLYASWFLPESPVQNAPSDPTSDLYFVPDPAFDIHENIIEEIDFLLEEFPALNATLNEKVSQSTYADPHLDLQLLEDIKELLQQPTADNPDVTYQERIEEIIRLADLDEQEEIDGYPDSMQSTELLEAAPENSQPVFAAEPEILIFKRNSGVEMPSKIRVEVSAAGAHLVIENIREGKMREVLSSQGKEEIAPGITIKQATDKVIDALIAAEAIVDPQSFIQNSIDTIISESSLSDVLKNTLNQTSTIEVVFKEITLPDKFGHLPKRRERVEKFTLTELCTDYHLRMKASNEELNILWPTGFTESFQNTILNADLQAAYKERIKSTLERPDVKELWQLSKQFELKRALEVYKNSNTTSAKGIEIADRFLKGKTQPQIIYLNNPRENTPTKVSNALYLGDNLEGAGLFVFLGADNDVIELPAGGKQKQDVIENNKQLQEKLLDRIPLYEKLSREDSDFVYSKPAFKIFDIYPRYAPIIFDSTTNAFEQLYKRQLEQVLSDIDTLVSTDEERFTDGMIAAIGKVLTAMSIVTVFPGATVLATKGARMAASFLFGASASSTELIRGAMSDDPNTAEDFRSNAYRGFIMEFAGPLAARLLGKVFSKSAALRIARSVFNRIKSMGHRLQRPIKWIPPTEMDPASLLAKMKGRFRSDETVGKLKILDKGPHVAQSLIKKTKIVYFSGPKEGYVYQGFVMRGEMRPPSIIFKEGCKLRTKVKDVSEVNGMKGGFGGGKDQLDPDGKGISTSAFYKRSGAGAFEYGGKKGGYTYLIDARQMRGYHLYYNDHWAKLKNAKNAKNDRMGFQPWELNYGQDIPPSAVIGCYDKYGKFTPNPSALQDSIKASMPSKLPADVLYRPLKPFGQHANATSEP